jgi:flagellar basal body L-ring protein FlgH
MGAFRDIKENNTINITGNAPARIRVKGSLNISLEFRPAK